MTKNPNLHITLLHHPVVNKHGNVISSAITNLDLHDISRAARTFGVRSYYVVTPLSDQRELANQIMTHWTEGRGGEINPARREALELIRVRDSVEDVIKEITENEGGTPETVVTCARENNGAIGYGKFREMLKTGRPYLLVFGTAWGLSQDFINAADHVLAPIKGPADYNHLSVRSAVSIILDRLIGVYH